MFIARSLTLCLTLAAATAPAHAENTAAPDSTQPATFLKETVVTGSRVPRAYYESPQALSFISSTQLIEALPTVTPDALGIIPGVDNSKDSPWEQRPVIRGLTGQRVLVLMDGSPINSARGNGPHPSLVDAGQIDRVEVVRGPSSVAYGSDALGGVINLITRESTMGGQGRSLKGSATAGGSSADQQGNGFIQLLPQFGRLSALISAGGRRTLDYEAPSATVNNSAFKDYNALANFRYEMSDRTVVRAGWQLYRGADIGIPGLSFESPGAVQSFSFPFYDRDALHLQIDRKGERGWIANAQAKLYWQREHRNFFSDQTVDSSMYAPFGVPPNPASSSARTTQDRYFDLDTYGIQAQFASIRTERYRVSGGLDMTRDVTGGDNVRFRTYYDGTGAPVTATSERVTQSVPDGFFDNYGGWSLADWSLHPQWTASAGARYTHYSYRTDAGPNVPGYAFTAQSVDDDALCGSLGLVYAARADLHLSANVANGYREPNAQDLFFSGPASVGYVMGNPALRPEKSVSYDVGMRWGPSNLAFSGSFYYSTYDNLIDAVPMSTPPPQAAGQPAYQYVNISKARIWGVEGEGEWHFMPHWTLRGQGSTAIGDITSPEAIQMLYGVSAEKVPLPSVPPFRGSATLRWRGAQDRIWVEPGVRFSWRTNRLPPPTPGVGQLTDFKKEWIVGDIMAGARFATGQRLQVGIRNLGNTTYRQPLASLDDPGISFVGSISTDF